MDEIRALFKISGPELDRDEVLVGRQGLRVGRSGDNNLALNHREISRQHMRIIWREDDKFLVEDLNSSNGVWLNESRLIARVPVELNEGDVIRVGPYLLQFEGYVYPESRPVVESLAPGTPADDATHELKVDSHGANGYLPGLPHDKSNWLKYLPAIYDDHEFFGRYLLIFESLLSPIEWMIDNFDMYLSPDVAPQAWLSWMASWFDMLLLPELPIERQRELMRQVGWLFLRRGTPAGLERLLDLYFGVTPEIIENEPCHFVVRLELEQSKVLKDGGLSLERGREIAHRLIDSQRPAFASYTLEIQS